MTITFETPARYCAAACGTVLESRPGRGRPAVYCSPECRATADNTRDRDRRRAEKATLDDFIPRAARNGWLEYHQLPAVDLPDDYWTNLALAVQVDVFHGPATDSLDDSRPAEFTSGICRIIREGTVPEGAVVLELDDAKRMTVLAVDDSAQDKLGRLWELRDPLRQQRPWMASQAWDGPANATAAVDLYGNPVIMYVPPGPGFRTPVECPDDTYQTCQEYYDRDRRRPYRAPYFGIAWDHGSEAIADHIAPALASYVADAT